MSKTDERIPNGVKIFISYSSKDKDLMEDLLSQLNVLKISKNNLEIWYDGLLEPGVKWDNEIKDKLHSAHIVLMLISANFFNSEYIWNIEVQSTLEKQRQGTLSAIPVILKPCDWTSTPIGEFQSLPRKGKSITSFADKDAALAEVVKELKYIINKWEDKIDAA